MRHIHCRMDWTGVQVTLWQLSREKSLIAKRAEMKGNSAHTSKANFGSDICEVNSSHPSQPVRYATLSWGFWRNRRAQGDTHPRRGTARIAVNVAKLPEPLSRSARISGA